MANVGRGALSRKTNVVMRRSVGPGFRDAEDDQRPLVFENVRIYLRSASFPETTEDRRFRRRKTLCPAGQSIVWSGRIIEPRRRLPPARSPDGGMTSRQTAEGTGGLTSWPSACRTLARHGSGRSPRDPDNFPPTARVVGQKEALKGAGPPFAFGLAAAPSTCPDPRQSRDRWPVPRRLGQEGSCPR